MNYASSLDQDCALNAPRNAARSAWEEAGELEEAGFMFQAVALYRRATRLWPDIDNFLRSTENEVENHLQRTQTLLFERFLLSSEQLEK